MQLLIQGVKIIDPTSPHNNSIKDIRIKDGIIDEIAAHLEASKQDQVLNYSGKNISPGWFDLLASFGDPGNEQKEDLMSGAEAAAYGGFTSVCVMPDTTPALHSKSEIEYIVNKNKDQLTKIYPLGAVTKNSDGKELTEMYDMHHAGAVAFTDAGRSVYDNGIMLRSLQYVKAFDSAIINIPNDYKIMGNAHVNEGAVSMQLGMYGIPDTLEELMVLRDIKLAEYTGSKLHLGIISSARSLPHIREAKNKGIKVTASVSAYQLYFDENELTEYDTNFKVNPPLRTKKDIEALVEALKDGTIDVICSYHIPHEADAKQVEFEYASFGMETIEATFGAANKILSKILSQQQLIEKIAINPRTILGIEIPSIAEKNKAELTIYDADADYIFEKENIRSKSFNSGFIGRPLQGKALAVINRNKVKIL